MTLFSRALLCPFARSFRCVLRSYSGILRRTEVNDLWREHNSLKEKVEGKMMVAYLRWYGVGGASNSIGPTVAILYCYHILSLKLQYSLASLAQTHKDHKFCEGRCPQKYAICRFRDFVYKKKCEFCVSFQRFCVMLGFSVCKIL